MFSTGWGEKSRNWSITHKSGLSAKILGVDGRVLMSHIELVCLVFFFFFHCCHCSSPLCDLLSTPPHHVLGCFLISINQSIPSFHFFKNLVGLWSFNNSCSFVQVFFLSCSVERAWFSLCFPKFSFETFCKLHTIHRVTVSEVKPHGVAWGGFQVFPINCHLNIFLKEHWQRKLKH